MQGSGFLDSITRAEGVGKIVSCIVFGIIVFIGASIWLSYSLKNENITQQWIALALMIMFGLSSLFCWVFRKNKTFQRWEGVKTDINVISRERQKR